MLRFLTEGFGTLMLVLAIGISTDPIAAGLMLIILLYIGHTFADVHLNPAVSIGVWTLGNDSTSALLSRVSGQFIGALGGAYLTLWIALIPYAPEPASSIGVAMFILLEFLFSGLFVLLFLLMMFPASMRTRTLFGVIIGVGYSACLMVVEPLIGFGMHPALNTAFSIVDYTEGGMSYLHLPVYLFTPLVAGILSALLHKKLMMPSTTDQQAK
ncbi:aquaporin [Rhodohalobacter sp. 8-1]|uniref:aquaporin n=1 Tax=Rhodohalobacter sp. 8-1 TaxID=3131972 RepID=UPI0030EF6265